MPRTVKDVGRLFMLLGTLALEHPRIFGRIYDGYPYDYQVWNAFEIEYPKMAKDMIRWEDEV